MTQPRPKPGLLFGINQLLPSAPKLLNLVLYNRVHKSMHFDSPLTLICIKNFATLHTFVEGNIFIVPHRPAAPDTDV